MKNAIVGQSGGPTAVINASLMGIIEECLKNRGEITNLYGAVNGIEGVLKEEFVDLYAEDPERVRELEGTPGAALGGCRYMIQSSDTADADIKRVFEVFGRYGIRYFFYVGGNDSMDTSMKLDAAAKKLGYDLKVVGVPKTIDNDIPETDHSPGYGSCVRYLVTSLIESGLHARSMKSAEPVTILVTVGRESGWLPAACSLARRSDGEPPHIICFPEVPFERERFVRAVADVYKKHGFVYIVAGEGLKDCFGEYLNTEDDALSTDAFGHPILGGVAISLKQIVEKDLGLKARIITPDICQQAASHLSSKVDLDEAEECGRTAVRIALSGGSGCMINMIRTSSAPYTITYGTVPLDRVANLCRDVPPEFIGEGGMCVTDEFMEYITPLIGDGNKGNNLRFYRGLEMLRLKAEPRLK